MRRFVHAGTPIAACILNMNHLAALCPCTGALLLPCCMRARACVQAVKRYSSTHAGHAPQLMESVTKQKALKAVLVHYFRSAHVTYIVYS
jgi:hypothetical protein